MQNGRVRCDSGMAKGGMNTAVRLLGQFGHSIGRPALPEASMPTAVSPEVRRSPRETNAKCTADFYHPACSECSAHTDPHKRRLCCYTQIRPLTDARFCLVGCAARILRTPCSPGTTITTRLDSPRAPLHMPSTTELAAPALSTIHPQKVEPLNELPRQQRGTGRCRMVHLERGRPPRELGREQGGVCSFAIVHRDTAHRASAGVSHSSCRHRE